LVENIALAGPQQGGFGAPVALVLDTTGAPRIAFSKPTEGVYSAVRDGAGEWHVEPVAEGYAFTLSLLTPDTIVFNDSYGLRTTIGSSGWTSQLITGASLGRAALSDGVRHYVYQFGNPSTIVLQRQLGDSAATIEVEVLPSYVVAYPSITTHAGSAYILFAIVDDFDSNSSPMPVTWRLATRHDPEGVTTVETVLSAEGWPLRSNVVVDVAGTVHAFVSPNGSHHAQKNAGGKWVVTEDVALGRRRAVIADRTDGLHLVHYAVGDYVEYVRIVGDGTWIREHITAQVSWGTSDLSIALDSNGSPHAAFYDPVSGAVRYAVRCSP